MRSNGISAEVAELFCDAQEPTCARLRSTAWRGHGGSADNVEAMSDEELLASAWNELPGEMRWSPLDRNHSKQNGPQSTICEATVRRLASQGATQREIAEAVGKAQSTVMNFMSRRGITVKRRKGVPLDTLTPSRLEPLNLNETEMVHQYVVERWSLKQVALEHRCSDGTVRSVLHRNNIQCRRVGETRRGNGVFGRARVRLNAAKVTELRARRALGESWESLGERYGIAWSVARAAGLGLTWQHVPMPEVPKVRARRKDEPDHDRVVELYLANNSTRAVGKLLGCHQKTVSRILKQRGIALRPAVNPVRVDDDALVALSLSGLTTRQVAAKTKVSPQTVLNALKRGNTETKTAGAA